MTQTREGKLLTLTSNNLSLFVLATAQGGARTLGLGDTQGGGPGSAPSPAGRLAVARGQGPQPCCPSGADTVKPTPGETGLSTEVQVSSHHRDRKCTSTGCVSDNTLPTCLQQAARTISFGPNALSFPSERKGPQPREQSSPGEHWLGAGRGEGGAQGEFRGLGGVPRAPFHLY